MDPDAALARIRSLCKEWNDTHGSDGADVILSELTTTIEGLDEWLSKGGFPPKAWSN